MSNYDRYINVTRRAGFRYRSLVIVTPPAAEPVTVAEAKQHLRIDAAFTEDDDYIQSLIVAARMHVETVVDRTLMRTQYEMRLDYFPAWDLPLPRPPLMADAVTLTYVPGDGQSPVSFTNFRTDRQATPATLRPQWNSTWPNSRGAENDIVITWWAGFGTTGAAVPVPARHAILMILSHWYRVRESVTDGRMSPVPMAVELLLGTVNWGNYK
jgi:uncharacterized phiE125 gp8 family phage protein